MTKSAVLFEHVKWKKKTPHHIIIKINLSLSLINRNKKHSSQTSPFSLSSSSFHFISNDSYSPLFTRKKSFRHDRPCSRFRSHPDLVFPSSILDKNIENISIIIIVNAVTQSHHHHHICRPPIHFFIDHRRGKFCAPARSNSFLSPTSRSTKSPRSSRRKTIQETTKSTTAKQ